MSGSKNGHRRWASGNSMTQEERFDRIDASLERLSQRFDARLDGLSDRLDGLTDRLQEMISRLTVIENRLDILTATVGNIEARFPTITKAVFDAGALASQLVIEQSKQKASATDLASRVAKLEEAVAKLEKPAA